MWYDAYAALARFEADSKNENEAPPPATMATTATQDGNSSEKPPKVAIVAVVATPKGEIQKTQNANPEAASRAHSSDFKHGLALGNRPKTYRGEVVSLDEWRRMSEWQKHGPDGRHFNGVTKKWEAPKS